MELPLLTAMRELKLKAEQEPSLVNESETPFGRAGIRERHWKTSDALKKELIETFLTPPTTFSSEWLNKLQQ